jgi:hypothetical protein
MRFGRRDWTTRLLFAMYFGTLVWPTSIPALEELAVNPWSPHRGWLENEPAKPHGILAGRHAVLISGVKNQETCAMPTDYRLRLEDL